MDAYIFDSVLLGLMDPQSLPAENAMILSQKYVRSRPLKMTVWIYFITDGTLRPVPQDGGDPSQCCQLPARVMSFRNYDNVSFLRFHIPDDLVVVLFPYK